MSVRTSTQTPVPILHYPTIYFPPSCRLHSLSLPSVLTHLAPHSDVCRMSALRVTRGSEPLVTPLTPERKARSRRRSAALSSCDSESDATWRQHPYKATWQCTQSQRINCGLSVVKKIHSKLLRDINRKPTVSLNFLHLHLY